MGKASRSIVPQPSLRRSKILRRVDAYLGEEKDFDFDRIIKAAVELASEVVKQRGIRKPAIFSQISTEDIGFYKDPYIIPEALVDCAHADRATIIAAILFSCLRPFGKEARIDDASFQRISSFVGALDPSIYGDVIGILKNALQIRAIPRPELKRKRLTVEDIRAKPTLAQAKRNDYYCRMVMRMTTHKPALEIRLTQQFKKLKNRKPLTELESEEEKQELLRELYHVRHFYAPMAEKLGLRPLMEDMQDEILRLADPEMHLALHRYVDQYSKPIAQIEDKNIRGKREAIDALCDQVKKEIEKYSGYGVVVQGRVKKPYAAWIKMASKHAGLERLFDIVGISAEVNPERTSSMSNEDYSALEHQVSIKIFKGIKKAANDRGEKLFSIVRLPAIKDEDNDGSAPLVEFRDYMKYPKPNGYRAIHIRADYQLGKNIPKDPKEKPDPTYIDIHVFTVSQKRINESKASQGDYKARGGRSDRVAVADQWGSSSKEVFFRTPEDDIHRLDIIGATAIDAAEAIHTGLAAVAIGEKRIRRDPFDFMQGKVSLLVDCIDSGLPALRDGDIVEIIKGDNNLAVNPSHRNLIDRYLKGSGARANMKAWRQKLDKLFI